MHRIIDEKRETFKLIPIANKLWRVSVNLQKSSNPINLIMVVVFYLLCKKKIKFVFCMVYYFNCIKMRTDCMQQINVKVTF